MHLTVAEMKMYGGKKVGSERVASAPLPFSACASELACEFDRIRSNSVMKNFWVMIRLTGVTAVFSLSSFTLHFRQQCHWETLKRLFVPLMVWCLTF